MSTMKRRTLFNISLHQTDVATLKNQLNELQQAQFAQLATLIKQQIGSLKSVSFYPYRVTNTNYFKVQFTGEKPVVLDTEQAVENEQNSAKNAPFDTQATEFHLLMILSGFLDLPAVSEPVSRLTISLTDATDAYWFVELLKHELSAEHNDGR